MGCYGEKSLYNCYGYSRNQIVFEHSPILPSALVNDLPATEESANDFNQ